MNTPKGYKLIKHGQLLKKGFKYYWSMCEWRNGEKYFYNTKHLDSDWPCANPIIKRAKRKGKQK